jgi:hypothetical protein
MALAQYSELFWFPTGGLAASIPARVFEHSTNTLATLWADAGGTVPLANPLSTSGTGRLEFWAEEGKYWIHIDSEAFDIAVGAAAQTATQQDILDEVARADATYAALTHAARHATAGGDPVTLTQTQITGLTDALAALAPLAGATFTGTVTIDGASFLVTGTDKGFSFRPTGGALDLEAFGSDFLISNWSGTTIGAGTQRSYFRLSADAQNIQVAGKVEFVDALYGATRHVLDGAADQAGFFGATPVGRPTVTGSWGDGSAGVSLADALADLGLITDNSTP